MAAVVLPDIADTMATKLARGGTRLVDRAFSSVVLRAPAGTSPFGTPVPSPIDRPCSACARSVNHPAAIHAHNIACADRGERAYQGVRSFRVFR